jgi:hypothetical protein
LLGSHGVPLVQSTHCPSLHTLFVPQPVPFGSLVPLSWHTGEPVVQSMAPWWHALPGVQATPAWQVGFEHAPATQTNSSGQGWESSQRFPMRSGAETTQPDATNDIRHSLAWRTACSCKSHQASGSEDNGEDKPPAALDTDKLRRGRTRS